MGIQGILIEDVSDDNEGEMYEGQRGIGFENEGGMYDEWENDDGEWEEEATYGRGTIPFQSDVENVEFPVSYGELPVSYGELPVSLLAGRSEVTRPKVHTKYETYLTICVVGEELGDDGSPSETAAGTVSDTVVCQALPEGLVEDVLLRLPVAAQARCRAVCKPWLATLASSQFLRRSFLRSVSQTTPPLCAVRYDGELRCKSPSEEDMRRGSPRLKFLRMDLSFLPEVFHSPLTKFHKCSPSGFVCITCRVGKGILVCVLNPVNQSFKVLPVLHNLGGDYVFLLMGTVTAAETTPSFKVYVPGVEAPSNRNFLLFKDVVIYSSITGEWKGFLDGPDVYSSGPLVVACNGDLYMTVDSTPPQLVRLSTEAGPRYLWQLALPSVKYRRHWENVNKFSLVRYRGRLMCCCGGIWMLDDARQVWVQIAERCPLDILRPYLPGNPETERLPETEPLTLESVHVVGVLLVFFYHLLVIDLYRNVAYDMLRRAWRKVPHILALAGDVFQPMPNLRL